MREIIFRGKSAFSKEWVYGDFESNRLSPRIHAYMENGNYNGQHIVDISTVGQFTGIRDKHGRKVYEGDIVRRVDSAYHLVDLGVVKYDNSSGAFVLECKNGSRTYKCTFKKGFSDNDGKCTIEGTYSYEVLGNVFDNKELLNDGQK